MKVPKKRGDRAVVYIRVSQPVRRRLTALVTKLTKERGSPQTINTVATEMIVLGLDAADRRRTQESP